MQSLKIGVIREGKTPPDFRVPLTPKKCAEVMATWPHVQVVVQSSPTRSFADQEYRDLGVEVVESVDDCDILLGVKEVPKELLLPGKTYLFFSHTIKQQPYNRGLLREVLRKQITLIDYETLTDANGVRVVAFGHYAGIVGAYNGLLTYGKKHGLYELKPAHECRDLDELIEEFYKLHGTLPPIKIAVTGTGRVGRGAAELLDKAGIRRVSAYDFLYHEFEEPVYAALESGEYHEHRTPTRPWHEPHFFQHPTEYVSTFWRYAKVTDLLINCIYWDPKAPRLFTLDEMAQPWFKINTIADVSCDINGSVPCTTHASTIADPVYDIDPATGAELPPYSPGHTISLMAVDNLPCELPRNSSREFGRQLIDTVFSPLLTGIDPDDRIGRATIARGGSLTERYAYLTDYVAEATVASATAHS
jgi:saccharopine dehydrogenase (NAD+, L-lysine forming)